MKYIKRGLIFFSLSVITFLIFKNYYFIQKQKITTINISKIPSFDFIKMDGSNLTNMDLAKDDNVVINFFDPECDYCNYMAQEIIINKEKLKNYKVIMVTDAINSKIIFFIRKHNLSGLPNIIVVSDPKSVNKKRFGTNIIPSFFKYKKGLLVAKIIGETKIDNLIK